MEQDAQATREREKEGRNGSRAMEKRGEEEDPQRDGRGRGEERGCTTDQEKDLCGSMLVDGLGVVELQGREVNLQETVGAPV